MRVRPVSGTMSQPGLKKSGMSLVEGILVHTLSLSTLSLFSHVWLGVEFCICCWQVHTCRFVARRKGGKRTHNIVELERVNHLHRRRIGCFSVQVACSPNMHERWIHRCLEGKKRWIQRHGTQMMIEVPPWLLVLSLVNPPTVQRGGHSPSTVPSCIMMLFGGSSLAVSLLGLVANLANFNSDRWKKKQGNLQCRRNKKRDVISKVAFGKGPALPSLINALDAASRIPEMTTGTDQQHLLYPPTKQRPMRASKPC